jgi:Arc/MetJ family transcription regulator
LADHADGVAYRVLNVEIDDAVLTRVVGDLRTCRLPCLVCSASRSACGRGRARGWWLR